MNALCEKSAKFRQVNPPSTVHGAPWPVGLFIVKAATKRSI